MSSNSSSPSFFKTTEAQREASRKHYKKNKEHYRDYRRKYYREHKEECLQSGNRKLSGTQNLKRTGFCSLCGTKDITRAHHLIPRYLTHDDSEDNLIELCKKCHIRVERIMENYLLGRF